MASKVTPLVKVVTAPLTLPSFFMSSLGLEALTALMVSVNIGFSYNLLTKLTCDIHHLSGIHLVFRSCFIWRSNASSGEAENTVFSLDQPETHFCFIHEADFVCLF